jgi:hypothetical protein
LSRRSQKIVTAGSYQSIPLSVSIKSGETGSRRSRAFHVLLHAVGLQASLLPDAMRGYGTQGKTTQRNNFLSIRNVIPLILLMSARKVRLSADRFIKELHLMWTTSPQSPGPLPRLRSALEFY